MVEDQSTIAAVLFRLQVMSHDESLVHVFWSVRKLVKSYLFPTIRVLYFNGFAQTGQCLKALALLAEVDKRQKYAFFSYFGKVEEAVQFCWEQDLPLFVIPDH